MNYRKKLLSYLQIITEKPIEKLFLKYLKPRVYHYHIRKTGGTTINYAFYTHSGYQDLRLFHKTIINTLSHRVFANGKIFVAWNRTLINKGNYFYAHSHLPMHKLHIPDFVFTITALRDPVKRLISHYNMLKYYQKNNLNPKLLRIEGKWLADNIIDFAHKMPKRHLKNQLYFFSKHFDISEAIENLAKVDFILITENLDQDLKTLEQILELSLPTSRQRKYNYKEPIKQQHIDLLKEILSDEYQLYKEALKIKASKTKEELKNTLKNKIASIPTTPVNRLKITMIMN